MDTAQQVKTNLVHYNLWQNVEVHSLDGIHILCGIPPARLDQNDEENQKEWVVPESMNHDSVSMDVIGGWFDRIAHVTTRPKRVTMAVVNDDGTVVYYFVHDGVVKPRQN